MRNSYSQAKRRPSNFIAIRFKVLIALILLAAFAANAQDRVVSLQGVVEFDTIYVNIDTTGSDTLYFSNVNAGFQKISGVVGKTPEASLNSLPSVLPFRVFNTGNATLFFQSLIDSTVCDSAYVRVDPLLYDGTVISGDSVVVGAIDTEDADGPLTVYNGWGYVDLTAEFVMYNAIRVIISLGDLTHGWKGIVAYGRVR